MGGQHGGNSPSCIRSHDHWQARYHPSKGDTATELTSGVEMTRIHTNEEVTKLVDVLKEHGCFDIDTARIYGDGSSEEYLGRVEPPLQTRGFQIHTKLYPNRGRYGGPEMHSTHAPEDLRRGLIDSLKALNVAKVDLWYLHAPDRKTPFEDSLRAVNELHKEGLFDRFGLSNYQSWEVAKICEICMANGWIMPSVYQGLYNAFHRTIEAELVPCLRFYGIALYVFNPLAGGFLTDRYQRDQTLFEQGERFDPDQDQGKRIRKRYWNDEMWKALEMVRAAAAHHQIPTSEAALRWLVHHSVLKKENGDGVIVGASTVEQLATNLMVLKRPPLPGDVVDAMEKAWSVTRHLPLQYWH
eukprot:Protomagalhaensia_wolfi_Nauph_80__5239@NODE_563_length_2288_cov_107_822143_g420_i0_p1_GENE_NODE_563_length_2288_cov_107_822143_g420_i0NODE_563_length_2288_cov_107_822143_g420_i0_p1_ORF_typecomplete_len355_score43_43Aldo_ket_red/PF00248_21/1_2e54_NODE_563_length_2288_cov_107_822143_g420_i012242288